MDKDLGKIIKQARAEKNLSQKQLAEMLKVTPGLISHWESNIRMPSAENLLQLFEILEFIPELFPQYKKEILPENFVKKFEEELKNLQKQNKDLFKRVGELEKKL